MKIVQFLLILLTLTAASCHENDQRVPLQPTLESIEQNEQEFNKTLKKHLNAIINKDLNALKTTLSPKGKMQLNMQGSETISSVDSFVNFHREWFQDTLWTMETNILSTEIGNKLGLAITESIYREPERNGKPYFNKMIVSYGLEKSKGKWFVIQDHASSIIKSTDIE